MMVPQLWPTGSAQCRNATTAETPIIEKHSWIVGFINTRANRGTAWFYSYRTTHYDERKHVETLNHLPIALSKSYLGRFSQTGRLKSGNRQLSVVIQPTNHRNEWLCYQMIHSDSLMMINDGGRQITTQPPNPPHGHLAPQVPCKGKGLRAGQRRGGAGAGPCGLCARSRSS